MNDGLDIPDFLKISQEDRRKAWIGYVHRYVDPRIKREKELRDIVKAEQKRKKLEALTRLKHQHIGEHYDRKLKMWIKNEK